MITIHIKVYRSFMRGSESDRKEVYRNSIDWNTDIQFPFDSTYQTLRMLYPWDNTIIEFSIV